LVARATLVAGVLIGLLALDRIMRFMLDFWLLESLGFDSIFWTNIRMASLLFVLGFLAFGTVVALPAFVYGLPRRSRRLVLTLAVIAGIVAGYNFSYHFRPFLLMKNGVPFGRTDPVFGNDFSFYMFDLPALWLIWDVLALLLVTAMVAAAITAFRVPARERVAGMNRFAYFLGRVATPYMRVLFLITGAVVGAGVWLSRYNLLNRNNAESMVDAGAEYLDVTGFFSTLNAITVQMLAVIFMTFGVFFILRALHAGVLTGSTAWRTRVTAIGLLLVFLPGFGLDFSFRGFTSLRDEIQVRPNEPNVQLDYIQRHVTATAEGFGLDKIETVPFRPKSTNDPKPDINRVLASPTIRNAVLWPGFVAYMEPMTDLQHQERLAQTMGDTMIYGPSFQSMTQQQKLRPYYDIRDIDTVRYTVDGQPRLFASALRELPLDDPQPWNRLWGQRSLLLTHGHGLVMIDVAQSTEDRLPVYASSGIPVQATHPELETRNPAVYYGEAQGGFNAYSNAKSIDELDFPTEQGRAETRYPEGVEAGVKVDNVLKRTVIAWQSGEFMDIFFSDLITSDTRAHYYRPPLDRLEAIAPFLYYDTDPYAVKAGDGISWMVNGMTTSKRYPYSLMGELGDKSQVRTDTPRPHEMVNYVRDSVKVTVDGFTGDTKLYKIADEPVVDSWAATYPDLFTDIDRMPQDLRAQIQFPPSLFHVMFDDIWMIYHMQDALTYFNLEDMWDDGDEVLGPMLDTGEAITFSIEPYYWVAEPGRSGLPSASKSTQFSMSMVFTPEGAVNLRGIATVYMEGDDYGRLVVQQIPKGLFYPGSEQADAAIDEDAFISQQIGFWNREGLQVVRGHTTPLLVEDEVIYVEPLFTMSEQSPIPRMERVSVVFRGEAFMAETLEDALREALNPQPRFPVRPGPELGGEPGFVRPAGQQGFQEGERVGGIEPQLPRDPEAQPR
jgi:uncharacterized membrane protein (UPF0182 family)